MLCFSSVPGGNSLGGRGDFDLERKTVSIVTERAGIRPLKYFDEDEEALGEPGDCGETGDAVLEEGEVAPLPGLECAADSLIEGRLVDILFGRKQCG